MVRRREKSLLCDPESEFRLFIGEREKKGEDNNTLDGKIKEKQREKNSCCSYSLS